jgi:alkylation response protein AidB-like acyl-CoA dehydrogenase
MSLFLAEKGDGFRVSRKLEKLGYKGIDSGEMPSRSIGFLSRLIGGEEGRACSRSSSGLELGRINVAARGVGIARAPRPGARLRAGSQDLRQAHLRAPGDPDQARRDGDPARGGPAARRIAARAYDRGERCDMEAGMAKLFATEAAI